MAEHSVSAEEVAGLRETLRALQEPLGYLFNADPATTDALIEGLIVNRRRHGYASCPCRLASGDRARDRDIVCPCVYRVPDVAEYGSCYCGLYVSAAWNAGVQPHVVVPERRPPQMVG